ADGARGLRDLHRKALRFGDGCDHPFEGGAFDPELDPAPDRLVLEHPAQPVLELAREAGPSRARSGSVKGPDYPLGPRGRDVPDVAPQVMVRGIRRRVAFVEIHQLEHGTGNEVASGLPARDGGPGDPELACELALGERQGLPEV